MEQIRLAKVSAHLFVCGSEILRRGAAKRRERRRQSGGWLGEAGTANNCSVRSYPRRGLITLDRGPRGSERCKKFRCIQFWNRRIVNKRRNKHVQRAVNNHSQLRQQQCVRTGS